MRNADTEVASPIAQRSCARFCLLACLRSPAARPSSRRRSAMMTMSRRFPIRRSLAEDRPRSAARPAVLDAGHVAARRAKQRPRSRLSGSRRPTTPRASSRGAQAISTRSRSFRIVPARSIRSMPRPGRSRISRSSRASSSPARGRSPPATPCAGSSATPKAATAIPGASTSWSSRRGLPSRPTSSSTPIGAPI